MNDIMESVINVPAYFVWFYVTSEMVNTVTKHNFYVLNNLDF
jgi:hypothetical protein